MTDTNDKIEFDQDKIAKLKPWDVVDHLDTDEMIAAYLTEVLNPDDGGPEPDAASLRKAIEDTIRALRKRTA
jgi:DNA-binding phage protein